MAGGVDKKKAFLTVKPVPCASCPYRKAVPSGIWAKTEYEVLRKYDGGIADQAVHGAIGLFMCHQADDCLCGGWVGHRRHPSDLLAIRLHYYAVLDESALNYKSPVPLFASGAEAADHGERDIEHPSEEAQAVIEKIVVVRYVRGNPVHWG